MNEARMLALQRTPQAQRSRSMAPVTAPSVRHLHVARATPAPALARSSKNCACGGGCSGCKLDTTLAHAVEERARTAGEKNHDSPARTAAAIGESVPGADASEGLKSPHWADDKRLQAAVRNSPPLQNGERGEPVRKLQAALVSQGFPMPGSTRGDGVMDGIWGNETTAAVRAFQVRESIKPPGGWEAGRKTLGRMDVLILAAPVPAPVCPAGNAAKKKTGCIQPIVIADDNGKNPTTAPSMAQCVSIWSKCCIDYTIKPTQTIKKSSYKTLDESPNDTPTAEETQLFADAGTSDCIQVFVPVQFAQGNKKGKQISGGGGTYSGGEAHPKIVVVEGAKPEVVAHEVGHASGHGDHDTKETVMKPTGAHNKANKRAVSLGVCSAARTGSALTDAVEDCCQNPT